jgi:hypothetical protein
MIPTVVQTTSVITSMIELTPNLPQFRRSGRWTQTDSGSLISSWASASISFILTSSSLSIRLGPKTRHMYTFGDSSTTLVCSISDHPADGSHDPHHQHRLSIPTSTEFLTFPDAEPGVLSLFDRLQDRQQKLVEITLVDWSSVLELVSIVVDDVGSLFLVSCPGLLCDERLSNTFASWVPYKRYPIHLRALVSSS